MKKRLSETSEVPSVQQDLVAARRLIEYSRFNRWLSDEQVGSLEKLINRLVARINGHDASPPPVSKPLPVAPPPPRQFEQQTQTATVAATPPLALPTPPRKTPPPARHPLDQPDEPQVVFAPRAPLQTRVTANLLKTFMEQSNIRWVELISAALIVVCSVGLVISLWSTLSSTSRFFPSLVFMLATIAVHGAGQYTLRQWKLRTTSRGILHIGLMLIPLAMLVGILLSRREGGLPTLNLSTISVISCGALIYGGLAITACKSLFSRRWPVVALHTIVASLTLLPINYLSERSYLTEPASTWSIVPMVLFSLWAALTLSRSSHRLAGGASGVVRWIAGAVAQCLFSGTIVLGFWILQVRGAVGLDTGLTGLTNGWWVACGALAAAWASWGWSVSLAKWTLFQQSEAMSVSGSSAKSRSVGNSWLIVAAWFIATTFSLLWLTSLWQVGESRLAIIALLMSVATWWLIQGWLCRLRVSLLAGAVSAMLTVSFIIEHGLSEPLSFNSLQWLSFSRIITMSMVGILISCVARLCPLLLGESKAAPAVAFSRTRTASSREVGEQFQIGGGFVIAAAAVLTIAASLTPYGPTPYGGNWAALLLCAYGVMGLWAGVSLAQANPTRQIVQYILPLGQSLLLLGAVRLCQTSPMLAESLGHLRPARSWAIGTAVLAMLWSSLAAGLRVLFDSRQRRNIDWLAGFATVLSLVTATALWSARDQLGLASSTGWFLPATCFAVFVAWRQGAWREMTLISLCAWVGSFITMVGLRYHWWEQLGLAASSATLIVALTIVVVAFEGLITLWQQQFPLVSEGAEASKQSITSSQVNTRWITADTHWGSQLLIVCGWLVLSLILAIPSIHNIAGSLGVEHSIQLSDLAVRPINGTGFGLTIAALVGLTLSSFWLGKRQQAVWLQGSIAFVPVITAMALSAWWLPPNSLIVAMWSLSIWLLLSDLLLPFLNSTWQGRSQAAWQQMLAAKESFPKSELWLVIGRALASGLLILGTLLFVVLCLSTELLQSDTSSASTWFAHVRQLMIVFGPLLLFSTVRWLLSVWNAELPIMTTTSALLMAVFAGCLAAIGLIDYSRVGQTHPWSSMAIVSIQTVGLISAGCGWLAILFTASRNFLGLRQMLRGKVASRELWSKALKGSRWQRTEKGSWHLSLFGLPLVVLLTLAAAWLVITYPIQIPVVGNMLERLGGVSVAVTVGVSLSLTAWLASRRGQPKFGLLAIGLGLIAPIGAAAYANWLIAVPARSLPGAQGFEPFRAIIVLWLIVLAIGLAIRIVATIQQRTFSKWGEAAWILLALVVGSLTLVSTTQDTNWIWPLSEMSALAMIILFSSVVTQQHWRAHVAAVIAAIGISAWCLHRTVPADMLHEIWLILCGPMWVALLASAVRPLWNLALERNRVTGQNPTAMRFSVEQSVSLLFPLAAMILSFLWMVSHHVAVTGQTSLLPAIILLSVCGLSLAVVRLWEPLPAKRGLSVYLNLISFGLVIAMSLSAWGELPALQSWLIWLASGLSAMAIMAGLLRELVRESSLLGAQLKLGSVTTVARYRHALHWMPIVHAVAAMFALVPCILLVLAFEQRELRMAATVLPFIGAVAILPIAIERGREAFRYCGLILSSTTLILLWWADLPNAWAVTDIEGSWIFVQRTFAALVSLGCIYPILAHLLRRKHDWVGPLMNMGWAAMGLGIATGVIMLTGSFGKQWDQVAGSVDIGSKLMTIVAWIAVIARLLLFAARPHSTDRNASVAMRKAAVFVAEFAIAFLCAATYYHFPKLFAGILIDWWPIVLFGIAMLSAGIGEWLRRLGQTIIADPVQQSSLLLPIIPLAGVWFFRSEDSLLEWNEWGRYAFLLVSGAGLYGLHGWARNSVGLRALSGLLALCSFWAYLHSHPDLRFTEHPQFWLLPPALGALVFAELNRHRLDGGVVVATRYTAILIAYLSSTSEIFLKAFEGQLWQPLLLLVLALAGVAAGIVLRVRAFLICGAAFTMVALLGMVWHAQQAIGQVWPWWAFGIATGICLIVCLGYFEKNRPRVIAYLDQFRQWEN